MLDQEYIKENITKLKITVDKEKLKILRDCENLSISDVAAMLGYKTPTGYWVIEQGKRKVTSEILYKLAKIYECSMESLLIAK